MQLTLNQHEADLLRDLLGDYLPALVREVARTEQRDLRHSLAERRDLVEQLLQRLGTEADARGPGPTVL